MTESAYMPLKVSMAARVINAGGVIAYPTEGTWGLGCDPDNKYAVQRLLQLKDRPVHKGLILIAASMQQFMPYLRGIDSSLINKLGNRESTPVTWLVPDNNRASTWIKGNHQSVALRVSDHPLVVALCQRLGKPIVSTSANVTGQPSASWSWQVKRRFGDNLDYLLHGALGGASRPSEIRDLITDKVLRKG